MKKTKILSLIVIVSISITLTCIPALAAMQYTKTTLYFNVNSLQEVTVTLLNLAYGNITSGSGTQTIDALNFTCGSQNCLWVNASLNSTGFNQTVLNPALTIKNTGSIATNINISANDTPLNAASCTSMKLYFENQTFNANVATNGSPLNTTNVTLATSASFIAGAQLSVYLFGNFSVCNSGLVTSTLWVWSY